MCISRSFSKPKRLFFNHCSKPFEIYINKESYRFSCLLHPRREQILLIEKYLYIYIPMDIFLDKKKMLEESGKRDK